MNVSSTNSLLYTNSILQASGVGASAPQSSTVSGSGDAASAQVSPAGGFFSQLQQLQQTDPTKLKQVLTDISSQLSAAAQNATGSQAQALTAAADKFQNAAQTGDISSLQPSGGPHGHHHHHGGGGSSSSTDSTTTPDPYAAQNQNSIADFINQLATGNSTGGQSSSSSSQSQQQNPFAQIKSIISGVMTQDLGS